jgi:hypothetical protein
MGSPFLAELSILLILCAGFQFSGLTRHFGFQVSGVRCQQTDAGYQMPKWLLGPDFYQIVRGSLRISDSRGRVRGQGRFKLRNLNPKSQNGIPET